MTEQREVRILIIAAALLTPWLVFKQLPAQHGAGVITQQVFSETRTLHAAGSSPASRPAGQQPAPITVDYPEEGSIFPPDIAAPTFLWRDAAADATRWRIDVTFADGSPAIKAYSQGERLRIGEIDPRCVAPSNELPALTPQQAEARTWTPEPATWEAIKQHSVEQPATITITGFRDENSSEPVSRGQVTIETSPDPVGAPVFFRDVPLMPSESEKGVIKPLPSTAIPLVAWRLRYVGETQSRLLLDGMHTCANCHSFSRDGTTLGMDLDGPQNDKGLYALASITPQMSIRNRDVISWSSFQDPPGATRVGFMSQVSPDGRYVMTTLRPENDIEGNFYVINFKDYRFLQVFYPTHGILAWYDRATHERRPLPGADDPRYVHTDSVWNPDGKTIIFARAKARDPYPEGTKPAERANDPNETRIQYDLCRIPFNEGNGGQPELITGASKNGMSNTFPKVSPDGRWIVFVQCRNGQLMRPDSQLYIVPAEGGQARRMRCNTPLMNSWHSFSPNGRWLVFASKSRSPYTQMFLTHLDEQGRDSPPILIPNATAANRAVNIPEFLNIPPGGLLKIDVPAAEVYRLFDEAYDLTTKGQADAALAKWKKVLELDPGSAKAYTNYGVALIKTGRAAEGVTCFEKALAINPDQGDAHHNLGILLLQTGKLDEALDHFQRAMEINPVYAKTYEEMVSSSKGFFPLTTAEQAKLDAAGRRNLDEVVAAILAPGTRSPALDERLSAPERTCPTCAKLVLEDVGRTPSSSEGYGPDGGNPGIEELVAALHIPQLRELTEQKSTNEGLAAQRQLLRIFVRSFKYAAVLRERNRNAKSVTFLEIAARVAPNSPNILYSLARGLALNQNTRKAVATLEAANAKGFTAAGRAETERAFAPLRGDLNYQAIIAKMRGAPERK